MSEQIASLDFQMDETKFDIEWKETLYQRRWKRTSKFSHRIEQTIAKGWLDDMNCIEAALQNAERDAQLRQRRQRYIDYSLKDLYLDTYKEKLKNI